MAGRISEEFGPWSSYECHEMKDILIEKDIHETGRVKLSEFYDNGEGWQFTEPSEHLRLSGSLDESSSQLGPQVIVPNYIASMSNCITSAPFFSICCLNECDLIYEHIEAAIPYPEATVAQVLEAVESLPTFPTVSPRMSAILEQISQLGGGSIPLHGRLFAQWLHFAFPRDCPYPHAAGTIASMLEQAGPDAEGVKMEEIKQHAQAPYAALEPSPFAGADMWDFEETVLEQSTPSDLGDATFSQALRLCAQVAIAGAFGSILVREGMKAIGAPSQKHLQQEYSL